MCAVNEGDGFSYPGDFHLNLVLPLKKTLTKQTGKSASDSGQKLVCRSWTAGKCREGLQQSVGGATAALETRSDLEDAPVCDQSTDFVLSPSHQKDSLTRIFQSKICAGMYYFIQDFTKETQHLKVRNAAQPSADENNKASALSVYLPATLNKSPRLNQPRLPVATSTNK